ncbi:hypothetical protein [Streptomyces sp. NPDC000229]|uniref:hypothetical protein n=1 Tax=Streptomyces sp. NPDC000229 TaxID=3154247 RepID=UPI00332B7B9E
MCELAARLGIGGRFHFTGSRGVFFRPVVLVVPPLWPLDPEDPDNRRTLGL